jgi:hypothetical protein
MMVHPVEKWLTDNKRTQRWLAERVDIDEAIVSKMLGGRCVPRGATVLKIVEVTGVPAEKILAYPIKGVK